MDPKKDDFSTYNLMAPDKLEQISTKILSILKSLMEENIYKDFPEFDFHKLLFELLFHFELLNGQTIDDIIQRFKKGSRQVCQYQFRKNDIVWICKSCQQDDTCVQCNECFQASDHTGHEVFFYHSQAGGCCDCGDASSWAQEGFCSKHGKIILNPLDEVPDSIIHNGAIILKIFVESLVKFTRLYSSCHSNKENCPVNLESTYHLILHNDDINIFDDVINTLEKLNFSHQDSRDIAMIVHEEGSKILFSHKYEVLAPKFRLLKSSNLKVALILEDEMKVGKFLQHFISWVYRLTKINDGFCRLITDSFTIDSLCELIQTDNFLYKSIAIDIHGLYLALMADLKFKSQLAVAYCLSYPLVAENYSRGIGVQETSIFGLSVQFLNRPSIVNEIINSFSFLTSICNSLSDMLSICTQDIKHYLISNRRFNPLIGDLKVIFTIQGVSRRFCADCIDTFLNILLSYQNVHPQVKSIRFHVEYEETKEWMNAFNLYLGICSLFDYLANWFQLPDSVITVYETNHLNNKIILPSVFDLLEKITQKIFNWHADTILNSNSYVMLEVSRFPSGSLQILEFPKVLSFHLFLHRFFSNCLRESFKYSHHNTTINELKNSLSKLNSSILQLVEIPMINVVWASQIKIGMWKKNGQMMKDQLLNYSDAPLCRSFKDLDTLLIQFCMTLIDPVDFMNYFLHRFDIFRLFYPFSREVNVDNSFDSSLIEEALKILNQILLDLPLKGVDNPLDLSQRVSLQLRKEIIHRLVSGPKSFFELQECLSLIPDYEKCDANLLDKVLDSVATLRETTGLEAPTLVLKNKLWDEYDPCFSHIPSSSHQYAYENRPKLIQPIPLISNPTPPHSLFNEFRASYLSNDVLVSILAQLLLATASKRLPNLVKYKLSCPVLNVCNETIYYRVLQIITLIIHCILNNEMDKTFVSYFFNSKDVFKSIYFLDEMMVENIPNLTIFEILLDLSESYNVLEEINNKMWHKWLIEQIIYLDQGCNEIYSSKYLSNKEDKKKELEDRKKKAREKAMSLMKGNADSFTLFAQSELDSIDSTDDKNKQTLTNAPLCIICQEASEEQIGWLGFSQLSTVLTNNNKEIHLFEDISQDIEYEKDLHVQTCGHAMHLSCFDDYFATVVSKSDLQNGLILNIDRGQFQCPLCKKLNNLLIPYHKTDLIVVNDDVLFTENSFECLNASCNFSHNSNKSYLNSPEEYSNKNSFYTRQNNSDENKQSSYKITSPSIFPSVSASVNSFIKMLRSQFYHPPDVLFNSTPINEVINTSTTMFDLRFVSQICEPLVGISNLNSSDKFQMLEYVLDSISSIVFTGCIESNEFYSKNLNKNAITDSVDSILPKLIHALASSIKNLDLSSIFEEALNFAYKRNSPLARPLIHNLVLNIINYLNQTSDCDPSIGCYQLIKSYRWIAIAYLVQIIFSEIIESAILIPPEEHSQKKTKSVDSLENQYSEHPLLSLVSILCNIIRKYNQSNEKKQSNSTNITSIIKKWVSFLKLSHYFLFQCVIKYTHVQNFHEKVFCFSSTDTSLEDYSKLISFLLGGVDICSKGFVEIISKGVETWLNSDQINQNFNLSFSESFYKSHKYCFDSMPKLLMLPNSYTQLHGMVLNICSFEYPGICLICGTILDAGGKGECTKHCQKCSPEAGIIFLLQDCTILFMFESRACYFSSPYIDSHGERHHHFKGRPLFLDNKRMDIINKIWIDHVIPSEVVKNRSSSNRVIISNHY